RYANPKEFKQRRPDGAGGWINNLKGVTPFLYRRNELLEAVALGKRVHIAEGEKDVDALIERGLAATTNPMGAGKWRDEYSNDLLGADVVVFPDNDRPGRRHVEKIVASLTGRAARISVVELPDLPEHGDVSDWIKRGGTVEQLEALIGRTSANGNAA